MTNPRRFFITLLAAIAGLAIALFIISRLLPYLEGPQVISINLQESSFQEDYVSYIQGKVRHTEFLKINSISIPIDESGNVEHVLALSPGRNTIDLELSDGFGKSRTYSYQIVTPTSGEIYPSVYNQAREALEQELQEQTDEPAKVLTTIN